MAIQQSPTKGGTDGTVHRARCTCCELHARRDFADRPATPGLFKGAATTVITQRTKDPIYACYERALDGGTKPTLAKLSLARLIAATVLRMWKNEEAYDPARAGWATEKIREG